MLLAATFTPPAPLGGHIGNSHDVPVVLAGLVITNGSGCLGDPELPVALARSVTVNGLGLWGADALSKYVPMVLVLRRGVTLMGMGVGSGVSVFGASASGEGAGIVLNKSSSHRSKSSLAGGNKSFSKDNKLVGGNVLAPATDCLF